MTFPLTLTVIVLGLSPADSDARTGTVRPINRSNLECRSFLPRRLTQLRRIAPRSPVPRANNLLSARTPQPRLNVKRKQASATIPDSAQPPAASFNPAFYEVALTTRAPSQIPQDFLESVAA